MNSTCKQVLLHFLKQYYQKKSVQKTTSMNSFFKGYFLKEELIKIITSISKQLLEGVDLTNRSTDDLLHIINDDIYILKYFIDMLEKQPSQLSPLAVWRVLEQLGLQTHYLGQKTIAHWDEYDHSNYRGLCLKAGKVKRIYGVYDRMITKKDMDKATPPKRLYDNYDTAILAMEQLIREQKFKREEIHILSKIEYNNF